MNHLLEIAKLGQSVWYDNLSRELLRSGELKRLVDDDGVSGVTSNPSIFEKALREERVYENDIHYLVDTGLSTSGIYEGLVLPDIQQAADILLPVYEKTSGMDGFVSLEISPQCAYDAVSTLSEARRLFAAVDRKNLMIKVPATPEGLDAFCELIAEGININVTLIFSLDQYEGVASAYIEGLEKLVANGGNPATVASVASFFVSRVDTVIDDQLKDITDPEHRAVIPNIMGKAGIANARLAYAMFKELFNSERFNALKAKGARPQRVLWASTSTKNPDYPDTLYADALIGPGTVNTMPPTTLDAFRDHGKARAALEDDLDEARNLFPTLDKMGIDIDNVMDCLMEKGVKAFADSYENILEDVATKRTRLLRGWGHRSASLGRFQKSVDEVFTRFDQQKVAENLWGGDVSLWAKDPQSRSAIAQRLGWLQIIEPMVAEIQHLRDFADEVRDSGITSIVLLGMGGSSLGAEVFVSCFGSAEGYPELRVLDTTVPSSILAVERSVLLSRSLFIVSSKSGSTIEVSSLYKYFRSRMEQVMGDSAGSHFVAITDPGTSLGKLASEHRFRRTFLNPPDIGGRFSALSYFGLVPAALIGADLDHFLMRAAQAAEACGPHVPSLESPGAWLGAIMAKCAMSECDKLSLVISPGIQTFGLWLEQLIAESTGKEGKGILPIDGEPVGTPDKYSNDRIFVYLRLDGDVTYDQAVSDLERAGHPVITQRLHTPYDIGREIFRWEFATAIAGVILEIDPFDQPNVQESKDITKKYLELFKREGQIPAGEFVSPDDPDLTKKLGDLLSGFKKGTYVALNAFIQPSQEDTDMLQEIRVAVRDRFKVATTLGFGPRYLHSTGQIHKGGADNGVFIQITADDPEDVAIPGESYTFGVLKSAQALGDYEALKQKGRRIIRVHLSSGADLKKLRDALRAL
ncbi:MAG: bifunctional transaldolase/phosoglucose isomerase [Desulfomonile tiedjei]|uniref:Transaldolase n=1 Tax=Desulfomonile tiedjei TaxID=2358 RepID=A0A9D6UX45_9BACT|nr:bifunctional transaldolase/phosoglucose isomerase [Desulfomonile tiedjei]